jgi:DNA-binding MarR family transcriptional regulator
MDQVSSGRCKELLNLLRKITQAVDLHSKYLNKHFGLTGPQLGILQELSTGEKTVSELARAISLSQGTVTDIIHRLENKNLIVKRRGDRDKRQVLIVLSEKCRDLLALAPPPLQETFMNYFSQIEEWEQLMILSAMHRIAKMMCAQSVGRASAQSCASDCGYDAGGDIQGFAQK